MEVSEQHVLERLEITNAYSAFIEVFVSDKADADNRVISKSFLYLNFFLFDAIMMFLIF